MKLDYPATGRNKGPIQEVLALHLPDEGLVLEIASGSGQHALHFAHAFPNLVWQPSDPEPRARRSIDAYQAEAGLENLRPALALDAIDGTWPIDHADVIYCANMVHIAPWAATVGLFAGAQRILAAGGLLVLYGPYRRGGVHTAPSNAEFDASLKARDPSWGVRDLEQLVALGAPRLVLVQIVEMPANNLTVILKRA